MRNVVFVALFACLTLYSSEASAGFRPDFDGDHIDDLVVWRPAGVNQGTWFVWTSTGTCTPPLVPTGFGGCKVQWGLTGDIPLTGDLDADGKSDFIVYRPSNNTFYVLYSNNSGNSVVPLGTQGDLPDVVDQNGDGRGDLAVFHPNGSTQTWYVRVYTPQTGVTVYTYNYTNQVIPQDPLAVVSAHYDSTYGGGIVQTANYHRFLYNNTPFVQWFVRYNFNLIATEQLQCTDTSCFKNVPVAANFGGQAAGLADYTYWNPSNRLWTVIFNGPSSPQTATYGWGLGSNGYADEPMGGDYDGDGFADYTVWRKVDPSGPWGQYWFVVPSSGICPSYMQHLSTGGCAKQWGLPGDVPVGYSNSQQTAN